MNNPTIICLVIVGIAITYAIVFALARWDTKRRHAQAMTTEELQARIAKDVTDADIDRMLPKSLRKEQ